MGVCSGGTVLSMHRTLECSRTTEVNDSTTQYEAKKAANQESQVGISAVERPEATKREGMHSSVKTLYRN